MINLRRLRYRLRAWLGIHDIMSEMNHYHQTARLIDDSISQVGIEIATQNRALARIIPKLDPAYNQDMADLDVIAESRKLEDEIVRLQAEIREQEQIIREMADDIREMDQGIWNMSQKMSWEEQRPIFTSLLKATNLRKIKESNRINSILQRELLEVYTKRPNK